jgi:AcrR family transcriptional regulator
MPKAAKRRTKARAPLSRERVLRAAITLADKGGIESLTMRKLGQALGVEAMSLYRHVANRDEILDGIVEAVIGEIEVPAKGADWKLAMRRRAISAHEVILRHPWASTLIESRVLLSPAMLRYSDAIIGSLRDGGFPILFTYRALFILDSYVYGFALQEVSWPVPAAEVAESTARLRAQVPADLYPNVAEMMGFVADPGTQKIGPAGGAEANYSSEFEFGLDLILDGLDRLRSEG